MSSKSHPPPVSEVWLCEMPFITIIASSVETYKRECCGLLIGYRSWSNLDKKRRAIIEHAYQFQMSERSRNSVTVPEQEDRCKDIIYKLSMFEPLGYFHSHPENDPSPSKKDIQSMNVNEIELVVSIKKKARTMPWKTDWSNKILSGVLGDYRFELSVYTLTKKDQPNVKKIPLFCPFAIGIGSKYFDTQAKIPE